MLANTRQTYGLVAQILHWITALLIFVLLVLGIYMHELPIDTTEQVNDKIWLYSLHKTLGLTVFATAILRVLWAFSQPRPLSLNAGRKFENLLAETIHWVLYGSIILMPVTGWLHHAATEGFAPIWWPFSQDLPFVPKDPRLASFFGNAHFFTALMLMGALFFHVAGAMKHVFVDHDQTFARMIPGKSVDLDAPLVESGNKKKSLIAAGGVFALLLVAIFSSQIFTGGGVGIIANNVSPNSGWVVDHEKSALEIEIIQNKNAVVGKFNTWAAEINFDLDNLEAANVSVTVDIASLTLGNISAQAISKDFLNAEQFPQAVFSAQNFTRNADDTYEVAGKLTLLDKTNQLTLPFDLKIENGRAFMSGVTEVQRLDFGLGAKGFKTDGILGFTVKINVTLEAERQ